MSKRREPEPPVIYCVFCYFVREHLSTAVTVMNGQAVCDDHTYYTQGGDFTHILGMVKRDELKGDRS